MSGNQQQMMLLMQRRILSAQGAEEEVPSVVSHKHGWNFGNYQTVTASIPTGISSGDMIVGFWCIDSAGCTIVAGWDASYPFVTLASIGHTGHTLCVGYREHTGTEPATYTFSTYESAQHQSVVLVGITGQNNTPAVAINATSAYSGTSDSPVATTLTTTTTNCLILAGFGMDKDVIDTDGEVANVTGTGWSSGSGWVAPSDTGDDTDAVTVGYTHRELAAAGESLSVTFTDPDESQDWSGYQVAIAP